MQKFHPVPDKRNPLQKDPLTGLRRFRPHQLRCHFPQLMPAGCPGRPHGAQERHRQAQHCRRPVKSIDDTAKPVHHPVGLPDHQRKQSDPRQISRHTACKSSTARVEEIFPHDPGLAIAKRLQDTDLCPLLLHHPVHGRHTHQRRHQKKEHRKDIGNSLHDTGITLETDISCIGLPSQHISVRLLDIGNLRSGVRQLLLRIRDLLVKLRLRVVVFLPAVLNFLSGIRQLLPALFDLLPGIPDLPSGLSQLRFSLFDLRLPGLQLLTGHICGHLILHPRRLALHQPRKSLLL